MNKTVIVGLFLLFVGCADFQQNNAQALSDEREREFHQIVDSIDSEVSSGAITALEGAKRIAAAAQELGPAQYKFHALLNYRVALLSRVERGDLPEEEAQYLYSQKLAEYEAERQAYIQPIQAQNEAINRAAVAKMLMDIGDVFRRYPYY